MTTMTSLAERLKFAREQAGLSQTQAAIKLSKNRALIARMEAGQESVDIVELARFADLYQVSLDWLSGKASGSERAEHVQLAARQIAHVKSRDLDKVVDFLRTIKS